MELVPMPVTVNKEAIVVLKEAIEMVESGEITQLSLSWVKADGSIGGDISGGDNNIAMWASIEHSAKSFYIDAILDE